MKLARKLINELQKRNWLNWGYPIGVFVFTIPLSQILSSRILGLLFFISLFQCRPWLAINRSWDIILYVTVLTVGLIYSEDYFFGLSTLETSLSLLLIPALLSTVVSFDEKRLHQLLFVFLIGTLLGSICCLLNAIVAYFQSGSSSVFLYSELTGLLDFQPTYYAYFLVFSITIGLYLLNYEKTPIRPVLMGAIVLVLFFVLMLTGGRTAFISILLVFSFFVLKFFLEDGGRIQRITFGLVVFMMAGLFLTATMVGDSTAFSDSWNRYDLWESAIRANDEIVFGVGTGDYKVVLNSYFASHGMQPYASESLNSHNQFIQTYLSNGLLGLAAFLMLIGRPLYLAFRRDNTLTILVLFPFVIYGMTEVFLGRYQGVVFFAFVHQIFVSHLLTLSKLTYIGRPA